jgi:hypothetical protein
MVDAIGKGWLGSLRQRVQHEIKVHARENRAMRRSRYSWRQRVLRTVVVGRSLGEFLGTYLFLDIAFVVIEAICNSYFQRYLPGWTAADLKGLLKDITSYFIAAQVGILGVVSVAIGIVTLISQHDTDVRLYYVESLAYEIVLSGVSLLAVLCVQLLWPLQYIGHILGFGGANMLFKLALTGFHLGWLLLNLAIFAQFVVTTLRFVEPKARERLRERYTANVIVPRDLSHRVSRLFYTNIAKEVVPEMTDSSGIAVTFGYGFLDGGNAEVESHFAGPSALRDIWLRPLRIALRSWERRTERTDTGPSSRRTALLGPHIQLAFSASFDRTFDGDETWCRRLGGVSLNSWERRVIRESFRFGAANEVESDLPTPARFLEELTDKVIAQIEQAAVTGFKSALDETLRYHRFLLDVHDTQTQEGQPLSLAEVGGIFEAPYQEWIRQYRRVFAKAADKIGADTYFIDRLGHVIQRLLPSEATAMSPSVVISLLDLGLHEVVVLEAWVTRRTTVDVPPDEVPQPRVELAGSDRRAYGEVVRGFVGAWEDVLRLADGLYDSKCDASRSASKHWTTLGRRWAFLERHLHNTAYFLASAVWNEDAAGADRYRDMLLRWSDTLQPSTDAYYQIRHRALLTPDAASLDWARVEERLVPRGGSFGPQPPTPDAVFGIIVRGAFDDVVMVTSIVSLAWYIHDQQPSDIGARTAVLLLRRQVIEGEGARFPIGEAPLTTFQSLFSLMLREALGKYGATLEGVVQFLTGTSERRLIPGRHYISSGWRGMDALRLPVLALLAAHLPADGDAGMLAWVSELAANNWLFSDGDASLRPWQN